MNITEVLNAQYEAAKKDLTEANKLIEEVLIRHKKEREQAYVVRKLLESILKDVEGKIEKLRVK